MKRTCDFWAKIAIFWQKSLFFFGKNRYFLDDFEQNEQNFTEMGQNHVLEHVQNICSGTWKNICSKKSCSRTCSEHMFWNMEEHMFQKIMF